MKKLGLLLLAVCFFAAGCSGGKEARIGMLETKSAEIESRMESMEQRLTALEVYYQDMTKAKLAKAAEAVKASAKVSVDQMTDSDIQSALRNAGFYTGTVDGKLGPNTTAAIKEFQKANGLTADGVAGDKTKSLLIKHLKGPAASELEGDM